MHNFGYIHQFFSLGLCLALAAMAEQAGGAERPAARQLATVLEPVLAKLVAVRSCRAPAATTSR